VNAFVIAATVLVAALAPLLVVASVRRPIDGLVALEAAGAVLVLALVCLAVGLNDTTVFDVLPVVATVVSWTGGILIARFLGRWT
jgi:multisubunit Na+/H+ antiporter MnhF subunit